MGGENEGNGREAILTEIIAVNLVKDGISVSGITNESHAELIQPNLYIALMVK